MSGDYERDDRISPFIVNKDPSILLNNEDTPWLPQDHNQGSYVKKFSVLKTNALTLVKLDQMAHLMTSNEKILNTKLLEIIKIYILYIIHFYIWIILSQS